MGIPTFAFAHDGALLVYTARCGTASHSPTSDVAALTDETDLPGPFDLGHEKACAGAQARENPYFNSGMGQR